MKKLFTVLALATLVSASAQEVAAKFGKGIKFVAADTSMSLKFRFRMQQLFIGEYDGNSEEFSSNALVRRSRLKFSGHAFTPKLKYKAELGLTNRDISVNKEDGQGRDASRIILDAVLKYQFSDKWQIWVGQTKLPGNRERVISSANLQFVDRSLLNSKFNIDRDMGIQLHGKYKLGEAIVQPKFALTNGEGRDITEGNHGGMCYTSRVDFLPLGAFEGKKDDYISSDHNRQSKPKLAIGVTYNYNQGAVRQQGQLGSFIYDSTGAYAENDLAHFEADLMFKYKGLSIMSEVASTTAADKIDGLSKNYNTGSAVSGQVAYLFENNCEIAARFTSLTADNDYSALTDETQTTIGFSKYIVNHALKIQTDYTLRSIDGKDEPVHVFRAQMEMQF